MTESKRVVEDVPCTFCGCLCDDIILEVEGNQITSMKNGCTISKSRFLNHHDNRLEQATIENNPADTEDYYIPYNDHYDFQINRQTYLQIKNDFSAKYKDKEKDYTERHVGAANEAVIELVGQRKPANFDLSMFRYSFIASRRIYEIMKNESYPKAEVSFKCGIKYIGMQPGHVVRIDNDRLDVIENEKA